MSDEIKDLAEILRWQIGGTDENPETMNLHLTREEFMKKMLQEQGGQSLLDLMEDGEWRVCERLGLQIAYSTRPPTDWVSPGDRFRVPRILDEE